jgi:hypothetical protein
MGPIGASFPGLTFLQARCGSRSIDELEHAFADCRMRTEEARVLGSGKRLFGDGAVPGGLRLVDSKISTTGVIIATYERAGAIKYGSFAPEQPTAAEGERRQ